MAKEAKSKQFQHADVIKQKDLLVRQGGNPPQIQNPRDEWVDDTISEDTFWDKASRPNLCATPPVDGDLRLIVPEPRADSRGTIRGGSVLRFRNERKELPLSSTHF